METAEDLRYLDPQHLAVAGACCEGMSVRTAAGFLGDFRGFLMNPATRRLRYVVIELLGRLRLLPVMSARVDVEQGTIELLEHGDIRFSTPFDRTRFPALSDDTPRHDARPAA